MHYLGGCILRKSKKIFVVGIATILSGSVVVSTPASAQEKNLANSVITANEMLNSNKEMDICVSRLKTCEKACYDESANNDKISKQCKAENNINNFGCLEEYCNCVDSIAESNDLVCNALNTDRRSFWAKVGGAFAWFFTGAMVIAGGTILSLKDPTERQKLFNKLGIEQ